MNQRAQRHARGPLGQPGLGVIVPRRSSNIEVYPRRVAGKFLDEHRAGNGAPTFAAANVLDIGNGALDKFTVFVIQGHLPHFFTGGFRASEELVRESLIRTEYTDVDVRERYHNSPG